MTLASPSSKEYKDYYDESYLLAVFAPKANLEKLKKQYSSMKRTSSNTHYKSKNGRVYGRTRSPKQITYSFARQVTTEK